MPLAATWGDLVVGVDLHNVLVPTPGGPVPVPLPHPFIGLTGDPAGALVSGLTNQLASMATGGAVGPKPGAVLVNGLPVMTTADLSRNAPGLAHTPMPPGTAFASPPSGEGIHDFGSLTVAAGGAGVVRAGDPVRSCADPAPLPTSAVIAIPKGRPVLVGGPPGVNVAEAAKARAASAACRTAWRAGGALARFVARHNPTRLRNILSRARCVFTGHPVDVASGRVMTWAEDFRLPGSVPLVFERVYSSGWADRRGPLGYGWSHSLDRAVSIEPTGAVCRLADGREVVFDLDRYDGDLPPIRREIRDPITGYTLTRIASSAWRVVCPDGTIDEFEQISGEPPSAPELIARVVRTTNRARKWSIRYTYGERARLVAVRDCGDREVKLEYDDLGMLARILLPDPLRQDAWVTQSQFRYQDGLLTEVTDPRAQTTRFEYDGRLLVRETDRNGLSFQWGYDGRGAHARCVRTAGDGGIFNQRLDYDRNGGITVVTDSFGQRSLYATNVLGLVTRVVAPDGSVTETRYNEIGKPIEERNPLGAVTTWSYDAFGNLSVETHADGTRSIWRRHPRFPELIKVHQNESGARWRFRYDTAGQLVELTAPDPGEATKFEWREGFLAIAIGADGRRTEHTYDRAGNVVCVRLPNGGEVRHEYDLLGRRTASTNPLGAREELIRDASGRVVVCSTADGNVHETSFDPEGNVTEYRNRNGFSRFQYVGLGWLASWEQGAGSRSDTVRFGRDLEGALIEIRNERNETCHFSYDRRHRLVQEVGFDGRSIEYTRDRLGQVVRITRPVGHSDYEYDTRGRIVEEKHSDGTWSRFSYRADGMMMRAENPTATVILERDRIGRVVRDCQDDEWSASSYDLSGRRNVVETSRGARMAIVSDQTGSASKVLLGPLRGRAQSEVSFGHDLLGHEVLRTLPGGVNAAWERDDSGRPRTHEVRATSNAASWSCAYSWAPGDRLRALADSQVGQIVFEHDHRGRLTDATSSATGVQVRAPNEIGSLHRAHDRADRRYLRGGMPRRAGDRTYGFDANGNLETRAEGADRVWRYSWDGAGMLKEVVRPDGVTIEYAYDALGRRLRQKVDGVETRWVWDGQVPIHARTAGDVETTWYHDPDSFALLAVFSGKDRFTAVTDHLGAPLALFDETGQSVWRGRLDTYGVPAPSTEPSSRGGSEPPFPHRWPGQFADEHTGLHYNRFRYYDPDLGQYISTDPIGIAGGFNPYAYVPDPLVWIDPLGLSGCPPKALAVEHVADFDRARRLAFERAGMSDATLVVISKYEARTGTAVEFKGPRGAKVVYDGPHADMNALAGHDKPHVGWQSGGKRRAGGTARGNITYDGPQHPHRSLERDADEW